MSLSQGCQRKSRRGTTSRQSPLTLPSLVGGEETTNKIAPCVSLVGGAEENDKHDSSLLLSRAVPRRKPNRNTLKQISPCVSLVGSAEEDNKQWHSQTSLSSSRSNLNQISPCVSLVGSAEEDDKQEQSQSNLSLRLSRRQCRRGRQTGPLSNRSLLASLL